MTKTAPQINALVWISDDGTLVRRAYRTTDWAKKVRLMRRDPTVSLVRKVFAAPILASAWTITATENAPDGVVKFLETQLFPWRKTLLKNALRGGVFDWGWAPFEVIIDKLGVRLTKVKPLLQELTEIQVVKATGSFAGFRQADTSLDIEESLLISYDVEGTDWYGEPIAAALEPAFDSGNDVGSAIKRYIRKIAGSHWVIKYPEGKSDYNGQKDLDNAEIALRLLGLLENSGSIAIPQVEKALADLTGGWDIDIKNDSGSGHDALLARAEYLDRLKVRAFGFPERSLLEGEHGTKAEAGVHESAALTTLELVHDDLLDPINWHLVNRLLEYEYGSDARDTAYVTAQPIVDEDLAALRSLYDRIIGNPAALLQELEAIDTYALRQRLDIPERTQDDGSEVPEPGIAEFMRDLLDV